MNWWLKRWFCETGFCCRATSVLCNCLLSKDPDDIPFRYRGCRFDRYLHVVPVRPAVGVQCCIQGGKSTSGAYPRIRQATRRRTWFSSQRTFRPALPHHQYVRRGDGHSAFLCGIACDSIRSVRIAASSEVPDPAHPIAGSRRWLPAIVRNRS